jgi:hypothetical protein
MAPAARWLVVAAVTVLVAVAPVAVQHWPVSDAQVDPWALARSVASSDDVGWSGEVRSVGSLDVPIGDGDFGGLSRLVGGSTDLRVWWRAQDDWRLDRLRTTGESDTVRSGGLTVRWDYEESLARFSAWSSVRLPSDVDVLPSTLASRLFSGVRRAEVTSLPTARVAGRAAAGVRLTPADERSSIARVDVWAEPRTGLPLRVAVYDDAGARPVLTSEVTRVDVAMPSAVRTRFHLGTGRGIRQGATLDDAAAANAYAPFLLPDSVAGLARRGQAQSRGAVGLYGRGPTALIALPLRDTIARQLGRQILRSSRAVEAGSRITLDVGPISVLLVQTPKVNFLLTGTVTPETLVTASQDLVRDVVRTR